MCLPSTPRTRLLNTRGVAAQSPNSRPARSTTPGTLMLTHEQQQLLEKIDIIDVIDFYTVPVLLNQIDALHAIVVYGLDEIFRALERYENHSPD